jgi:hypothetical protein
LTGPPQDHATCRLAIIQIQTNTLPAYVPFLAEIEGSTVDALATEYRDDEFERSFLTIPEAEVPIFAEPAEEAEVAAYAPVQTRTLKSQS